MIYSILRRTFPTSASTPNPRRIVLARPCCIGDVVMATAALSALRNAFPDAQITWAVGPWSARAIAHHPAIDSILDTGADMPLRSPGSMLRFVSRLRAGQFDLAVSLVRSPLMSLAIYLSGIPVRAGLDSGGRGFGYNLRVPIDPAARERESEIYLSVVSAIAGREVHAYANLPVADAARRAVRARLAAADIASRFIVAHPGGGDNPGARLASKRYPPAQFAELLNRLSEASEAEVILLAGPGDGELVSEVASRLTAPASQWVGALDFQEIGALAADALVYIGNDTGLTHLAAASGARAVMLMGPTDPQRYAPFTPDHLALWKPVELQAGGAAQAGGADWNWARDGISVDDAVERILAYLDHAPQP
ncbi:MAG: glycosyltransferase family 9 protein [Chloroflexi bacterium]|nr:glycosyltransferase family 9 protein [Chloroflexota bacterium]